MALISHCPHCDAEVVGSEDRFCCSGCELAWALVHEAGLEKYYETREVAGARPEVLDGGWDQVVPKVLESGDLEVSLTVDGLRCSSCTWVVERLLERADGVRDATVSYANGHTRVVFDAEATDIGALASVIASVGYSPRPLDTPPRQDDLLPRLGVAAFCAANLMLLTAGVYAGWVDGMEERYLVLFRWLALGLATPVAVYSAAPFVQGAVRGLRVGAIGMDVPIALAVAVLYGHGVVQTLVGGDGYLDSLGMLVTLLLIGRFLERRGRRRAAEAASAIAATLPVIARLRHETGIRDVPVGELAPGDIVEVGMGEELPADGIVVDGEGAVQMSLITGESTPVTASAGTAVVAGATVQSGALGVRVDRVGGDTVAMRMADAVRDAASRPMPVNPADRLAPAFTLATLGVAGLAGVGWMLAADVGTGLEVAVAVLVVACPCALGLSVPLAVSSGLGAVARRGVVLRDGASLLALADIHTVAMDKTGTVTAGQPQVLAGSDQAVQLAAALERSSRHPIARAILQEQLGRGLPLPLPDRVVEVPGKGIHGQVGGVEVSVTSAGAGCVRVDSDGSLVGMIRLGDAPRDDARSALNMLHTAGLVTCLLSGDHPDTTRDVGLAVGVQTAVGGLGPSDKEVRIAALRESGPVLFVGDGLNDGVALASADVGLAMYTGSASTLLIADGVVSQPALRPVVAALAGARATRAAVRSNLNRALVYNAVAVCAAAAGLVNPLVAAILMPLSSAWVIRGALSVERRLVKKESKWT